ncbi:MAG: hypothetical protein IPP30_04320 [Flavobacterium sp.]|nr:hypothetical protein [Flavobacterium sp.]
MENFNLNLKTSASIRSLTTLANTLKRGKSKITFENSSDIQIYTDENYLKTIIRNLTGNAIKALDKVENPTIIWKVWQEATKRFYQLPIMVGRKSRTIQGFIRRYRSRWN